MRYLIAPPFSVWDCWIFLLPLLLLLLLLPLLLLQIQMTQHPRLAVVRFSVAPPSDRPPVAPLAAPRALPLLLLHF